MENRIMRHFPLRFFDERPALPLKVHGKVRGGTMLGKNLGPFLSNIADPKKLGTHLSRNEERKGEIYTRRGGFIDIAHLRNMADNTKSIFDAIVASQGGPVTVQTRHGTFTLTQKLPNDRTLWADVAMTAANQDGLGYEIFTYGVRLNHKPLGMGMMSSAFSPEDLTSNYVGTYLAREALLSGEDFNAHMTAGINRVMTELEAVSPKETGEAMEKMKGHWMKRISGPASFFAWDSLLRRDFLRMPWFVPGTEGTPSTPEWLTRPLPDVSSLFEYTHTWGTKLPRSEWPNWIQRVRDDAKARWGDGYDRP
jgi:hypothetical protein